MLREEQNSSIATPAVATSSANLQTQADTSTPNNPGGIFKFFWIWILDQKKMTLLSF